MRSTILTLFDNEQKTLDFSVWFSTDKNSTTSDQGEFGQAPFVKINADPKSLQHR